MADYSSAEYFKEIVKDAEDQYHQLIAWSPKQKAEFSALLTDLDAKGSTTRETGDKLERIVDFIIKNSFFFEIHTNIHTKTNEIDEVIVLSDQGQIALHRLNLPRKILPIEDDIFLGECKNYFTTLGVTYVGKFYSLLNATGSSFGIIFTRLGLTGDSKGFEDGYGLTKVLRMIEQAKNPNKDFNIIVFTYSDYQKLLDGTSFFEIVKAKKLELQLAADYNQFIKDNRHEAEDELKNVLAAIQH